MKGRYDDNVYDILNINDQITIIKKYQIKILWLKNTITEMKYSLAWLSSRTQLVEEKYR